VVDYACRHVRTDYGCSQVIRKKDILPLRPQRTQRERTERAACRKGCQEGCLAADRARFCRGRRSIDARKRPAVGGWRRSARPASSNLRSSAKSAVHPLLLFLVLPLRVLCGKTFLRDSWYARSAYPTGIAAHKVSDQRERTIESAALAANQPPACAGPAYQAEPSWRVPQIDTDSPSASAMLALAHRAASASATLLA